MTIRRSSAFLVLLAILAGCPSAPAPTPTEVRQPSARTRWLPVRPASSAAPTEAPAKVLLSPEGAAVVVIALPARILKIWVRAGDQVQVGAPLLDVYIPEAMSALAAKAAAATSIAVLERRRAQLASLEAEGLVKASEVAALAIDLAKYQGEALRADATLQSVQVSSAGPTRISAPIAGIVTEVSAIKGELRSPSDGPLVRLRASVGGRVEVRSPTALDERGIFTFRASGSSTEVPLRLVSSVPNTAGAGSIAWLEGPDNELKAGSMGVLLTRRANDTGFVVPTTAIASDDEGARILVRRRDAEPRIVPVKVLHVVSTDAIVEGALSTDDLVASDAFVLPARDGGGKQPMIERLVAWSVDHRKLLIVLWTIASFAFAGVAVYLKLDALPDITSNQVQVLTTAPGLTPDEVELRITRPLEASLGGLPKLVDERSLSRYGLSAITLVFEDSVDILRARQLIAERLSIGSSRLPPSASAPELGPITGGLGEIYQFTLASPSRTPSELLELVQFRIAPLLKSVPGVVEVNTWGGARRTMEVRGDPVRMAARGITLEELRAALGSTVGTYPGASIEAAGHHVLLRGAFLPTSSRDLADALVKLDNKDPIRVGDVALVGDGSLPRLGAATRDGRGETVYVMVQMLLGANARDVTHAVRSAMTKVKEMLPTDVQVDVTYDRSTLVDATLVTVAKNLLEGGLLVCIILFFTLGSIRAGLLVAISIPAAMLGAAASMVGLGLSGNLMSLGAVDFGLLVDGAVVLIERLFHHDGKERESWAERVKRSCSSVARPSFFAVAVILLVYVPILSLTGVDGKLFRPMAMTVVLALIFALLFTLTFIPAAAATFLNAQTIPHGTPRMVRIIEHLHALAFAKVRANARLVAVLLVVVLAATVLITTRLGSELTPTLDEKSLVIQTTRRADLSVTGAIEQATKLERAILQVPEVLTVASRLGSPAVATDTMGLEQADIYVNIAPQHEWRPGLTRDKLLAELQERIDVATPNSDVAFTQPVQMRFNELLGGAPFDVVLNLIGEDRAALMKSAHAALDQLHTVNGAVDGRLLAPEEIGVLEVRPDPMGASVWGLSVGEVLDVARSIRQGIQVGSTFEGPLEIPVVLRLGVEDPHPSNIGEVLVPTPRKDLANLSQLAAVETLSSPAVLFRRNGERRVLIGFNVRGRELGDVVTEAKHLITANVPLPEGVRTQWGGQFESLEAAQMRLAIVIPIVLLLIAGLLFLHYRAGPPILWTLSTIPYASFGGLAALALRGMSLSISAGIGFIALWGIAVMNGTVLITEIRALESQGFSSDEATIRAAKSRARPVSMTALVAALGFLPMALSRGTGAEVQRPLATVVIGGLIVSTALTLLVLPVARLVVRRRSFAVSS